MAIFTKRFKAFVIELVQNGMLISVVAEPVGMGGTQSIGTDEGLCCFTLSLDKHRARLLTIAIIFDTLSIDNPDSKTGYDIVRSKNKVTYPTKATLF